jgi:hypothetical protein
MATRFDELGERHEADVATISIRLRALERGL